MRHPISLLILVGMLVVFAAGCTPNGHPSPMTITVVDKTIEYSQGYTHYVFTDGTSVYDTNWLTYRQLETGKAYTFRYDSDIAKWVLVNGGSE